MRNDLTGKQFGRWTVLKHHAGRKWRCQCVCGVLKEVLDHNLHDGQSKSCGCLKMDNSTSHRLSQHPLYFTWHHMNLRCSTKCDKGHRPRYYGRGIRVCTEWQDDPTMFITWAENNGWLPGLELDRRDNDLGYSPENCRWVTQQVNSCNIGVPQHNTSGFTGVSLRRDTGTWTSRIMVKGLRHHLGHYGTPQEAAHARNEFILKHNLPHPVQEVPK